MKNCLICSRQTKRGRNKFCSKDCELVFRKANNVGWHKFSRPEMGAREVGIR